MSDGIWRNWNPSAFLLLLLSHFSHVRLCDPINGSPPGSPIPGILCVSGGDVKWCSSSPQKVKHRAAIWPSNSSLRYASERIENRDSNRYLHTRVHRSFIHNSQRCKQLQCPSTGGHQWINKTWYIHSMEYYSALKRNDVLIQAETWMKLKNVVQAK